MEKFNVKINIIYGGLSNYIIYLLLFFIFFLDLITPLGVASGALYGFIVSLTFCYKKNQHTYSVTFLSIVLAFLGYYFSPEMVSSYYIVVINRVLAVIIIVLSSVFVIYQKKSYKNINELNTLSTTDPLTLISNRLAFNTDLKNEIARNKRYARQLTIALIDMDNLKFINDNHGHFEGDKALRVLATFISDNIRDSDHFYRIGGDEFAILFIETSLNKSISISDSLRKGIEIIGKSLNYPLTISVGLAILLEHETQEQWLCRADAELYKVKKSGKNNVSYKKENLVLS